MQCVIKHDRFRRVEVTQPARGMTPLRAFFRRAQQERVSGGGRRDGSALRPRLVPLDQQPRRGIGRSRASVTTRVRGGDDRDIALGGNPGRGEPQGVAATVSEYGKRLPCDAAADATGLGQTRRRTLRSRGVGGEPFPPGQEPLGYPQKKGGGNWPQRVRRSAVVTTWLLDRPGSTLRAVRRYPRTI